MRVLPGRTAAPPLLLVVRHLLLVVVLVVLVVLMLLLLMELELLHLLKRERLLERDRLRVLHLLRRELLLCGRRAGRPVLLLPVLLVPLLLLLSLLQHSEQLLPVGRHRAAREARHEVGGRGAAARGRAAVVPRGWPMAASPVDHARRAIARAGREPPDSWRLGRCTGRCLGAAVRRVPSAPVSVRHGLLIGVRDALYL